MSAVQPVIIGAGAGGLMAALCLAPRPVTLVCAGALGRGAASGWAQGGIAAAIGADDSPAMHAADTLSAGAGLCDPAVVAAITAQGPWLIETLAGWGAKFAPGLGLEAAHGRRRIVHAADATGAEVMRVLIDKVRATPSITILEHTAASELLLRDGAIAGVRCGDMTLAADAVILATGGVGGLFAHTTNPLGATGAGIALAARAGAALRDMEFVQFHPTALAAGGDPMPLVSEALRGEGATFVTADFAPLLTVKALAARDIVARAVAAQIAAGTEVFLDARRLDAAKFPVVFAACRAAGIDPARQPIPVRPAAHYHMGGIAVNADSESNVSGLFACGEVAATGLHGANRLASNSLLEAMVTGRAAAAAIAGRSARRPVTLSTVPQARHPGVSPAIRDICSLHLGILRSQTGLAAAVAALAPLAADSDAAFVALLIARAALARQESRGAHFRTDFPATNPALAHSFARAPAALERAA